MTSVMLKDIKVELNERTILNRINMELVEGKVTTIIGPNGCGKSTMLKTISRIISAKEGGVYINDMDIRQMKSKDVAKKVGILSQKNRLQYDVKVRDLVSFSRYPHLKQAQRVWISLLLAQGADVLLLDEPTTYLDIHHQLETLNIVKRLNEQTKQTVVMVLHDINHAIMEKSPSIR